MKDFNPLYVMLAQPNAVGMVSNLDHFAPKSAQSESCLFTTPARSHTPQYWCFRVVRFCDTLHCRTYKSDFYNQVAEGQTQVSLYVVPIVAKGLNYIH